MALTDEQRTMLQLLVTGQSYDDIAGLLGIPSDEVRSRARDALREMGGADPDAQVQLSDYLLGQADPIGRADASRHLQNDPAANDLATRLVSQLRLLSPSAQLPEIPPPRGAPRGAPPPPPPAAAPAPGAPPSAPPPAAPTPGGRRSLSERVSGLFGRGQGGPSKRQSQVIVGLGAGALLLIVAVLAIAGVFGGDDDSSDEGTATTASGDAGLAITQLAPVSGDTGATGQAVFAQANDQPLLQINLTGLQPAGKGQTYIVWLFNSDRIAFPIARDQVGQNGNLTGAAPIPQEIVPLLGQFGCVDVSLASNAETQAALQQAVEGQTLPRHSGETVLRGQIPTAPGEEAPTGADSQCEVAAPADAGAGGAAPGAAVPPEGTATPPRSPLTPARARAAKHRRPRAAACRGS